MNGTVSSIPPLAETPDWRVATNPSERHAAAVAWVKRGQREMGCEHVAVLTRNGILVHAGSSGLSDKVGVPSSDAEDDVVLHHSHPGEDSLSAADFGVAWSRSAGSEVRAYTPNASVFAGRSLIPPARWRRARDVARASVASELRVLGRRDDRSLSYLAAHLVNAEMERLGLVWYKVSMGLSSQRDLTRLASDTVLLRSLIRREFERDG